VQRFLSFRQTKQKKNQVLGEHNAEGVVVVAEEGRKCGGIVTVVDIFSYIFGLEAPQNENVRPNRSLNDCITQVVGECALFVGISL
jgi:hypothetical protein